MLRAFPSFFLCFCLLASPALAYDTELSDTTVREAYFLGQRGGDKMRDFFAPYTKHPALPKKGPNVSEIRLLTPLAQVVQISGQVTSGYSAQQAHLDYQQRGDTLLLIVHIQFTPTYGPFEAEQAAKDAAKVKGITLRPDEFWQDFRYGIKQRADWIEPRSIHGEPDYGTSDAFGNGGLVGAWVYIEYDAYNVTSDDTEISVFTTDDQEIQTSFDLAKLH